MTRFGAWIHSGGGVSLESQIQKAKENNIQSARSYSIDYSERIAELLRVNNMTLLAGMHIDADALIEDWRSQVRLDELERYHNLGVPLEAICVGNELRQFGNSPEKKRFTARIAYNLARVLQTYRAWLDQKGYSTPLTYAMEGIVFDSNGVFHEHLYPLIDACDIVSVNLYPMDQSAWHGPEQFSESRDFLYSSKLRSKRLLAFEIQLRNIMELLESLKKPLMLSETGFTSAIGFERDETGLIIPVNHNQQYGSIMELFVGIINKANEDYNGLLRMAYFYEWRDNPYHDKITSIEEHSPIHCAFGLCDRFGEPKFDIKRLLE